MTSRTSTRRAGRTPAAPAASRPVARVAVDVSLPHLDRPFDYLVPETLDAEAVPGCRVRVRFAGQRVDGFLLDRADASDHAGRLARLERVVSAEPVLTPEVLRLARAVADRYAGTLADVLRLAVPPRHARAEQRTPPRAEPGPDAASTPRAEASSAGPWAAYPDGPSLLDALRDGRAPRAVWSALPDRAWPDALATAVAATLSGGRGAVVVVPDGRDVAHVDAALTRALGDGRHVTLTAEAGPETRYRRWLTALRGHAPVVVGTRAAMFAPVLDVGLVVLWDDGDDVHADPHAPYPHPREVLALRAHLADAAFLTGGHARSVEATQLVAAGWARPVAADRATVRAVAPRVVVAGEDAELARDEAARTARLPSVAWRTARQALEHGPVLVQVPRRGYLPMLACRRCRAPSRCPACHGPLTMTSAHAVPSCRWCGRVAGGWQCPECGGGALRALVVGARRTAEELGRAFPRVPVRTSGRDAVLDGVAGEPALVVATPGAEPVAEGGYAGALLLDGWALLSRPDLRAAEEAVRRWANAAALVRPAPDGGTVVLLAEPSLPAVQALVRWDPVTFAAREREERAALGFPPTVRMASLTGPASAVADLLGVASLPAEAEVLGPVEVADARAAGGRGGRAAQEAGPEEPVERALVRVPHGHGGVLAAALKDAQAVRSARKASHHVRVQIDPRELV